MTRKLTRNSPLGLIAPFIAILTLLIAVAVLAQMTGAGRQIGKSDAVLAPSGTPASAQAELPLIPRTNGPGFTGRSHTRRRGAVPMAPNPPNFEAVVTYGLGGRYPVSVVVADVNLDGKPDLVVASGGQDPVPSSVGVLLGNGDGTFQPVVISSFGGNSVAAADINRDGKPDLVVVGSTSVVVQLVRFENWRKSSAGEKRLPYFISR